MFNKTFKLLSLCAILIGTTFSQNTPVKIIQNGDVFTSNQNPIVQRDVNGNFTLSTMDKIDPVYYTNSPVNWVTTELSTDARTVYDLQSNGCVRYIWQNPANPLQLHAIFTHSADPAAWPDRNVRYFYSANGGTTWDYLGAVSLSRAGFGSLSALTSGRAIVATHTANAPSGDVRTQVFVDIAPGGGTWTAKDPGIAGTLVTIWPSLVSTTNNGCLVTSSINATPGPLYRNQNADLTTGNTWSGWTEVLNGENANQSAVGCSGSTLGIAYLTTDGGISYMQSNDNGATWGAPTVVRAYTPADSNGTLRSVEMIFQNGQPRVIFGVCKVLPVAGSFFPGAPSYVYSWSPTINSGNPVLVDSSQGLRGTGEVDVYTSVCRGVLGASTNGNGLYSAWCRVRLNDTSAAGIHFFDIWFAVSTDGGATWTNKTRMTNISGPLKDNRWPSLSPTNNGGGATYFEYMVHQQDSIPGTYVNAQPVHTSYQMFTKITLQDVIGITPIGGEIPNQYALHQNFPNPFNPTTNIRFDLPKNEFVTLKVYNAMGQEVATLINENVSAGAKVYDWNAINIPSGVYFYTLTAGDFKETKKMILVK